MGEALIFIGILIFAAHLFAMIFSRKKIPDVLLLMIIGIIIGPLLGLVSPNFMGQAGRIFTTVVLVVILFEGGIDISISDLKRAWKPTITLTLASVIGSVIIVTVISLIIGLSFVNSLIVGFILCCTSSAVVIPITRQLKLSKDIKTALVLESAISDIICFVFVLAIIESEKAGNGVNIGAMAGGVISSFVMATIIGFISAIVWGSLLQKVRTFKNSMFLTPAYVFIIYGISESIGFSGAISALAFGITIANMEYFNFKFLERFQKGKDLKLTENELSFVSEIVFVLKTFFFVYIGISIPFVNTTALITGLVMTIVLLVMRIFIAKFFSPKSSNVFDKSIISLMIPKGLVSAILASIPEQMGLPQGEMIKYIVYATVFFSILICSIMIFVIERYPRANIILKFFFHPKSKGKKYDTIEEIDE
ncbi:MAG: cation:proton antiporter [Bacteroidales bacterium]|jgi:NhaP-type Na+/H+ or K+/H+ antiporter